MSNTPESTVSTAQPAPTEGVRVSHTTGTYPCPACSHEARDE